MAISPSIREFTRCYNNGESQLVWESFANNNLEPVVAMEKLAGESEYHLLYESALGGKAARYSIIAMDPEIIWKCENNRAKICRISSDKKTKKLQETFFSEKKAPFSSLRELLKKTQLKIPKSLPQMASGIFGYMSYDMVRLMEKLPDKNPDKINIPQAVYFRPRVIVIFDSEQKKIHIISSVFCDKKKSADDAYKKAEERIRKTKEKLKNNIYKSAKVKIKNIKVGPFVSGDNEEIYSDVVARAREYVFAGDICQVVPSRRWKGDFNLPALELYKSLRELNPSPYLFYIKLGDFSLVGSSPEILVRVKDNKVTIRPIAGTRRRGKNKKEDEYLAEELLSDEKEISEHLMLLDLGRNDVGRVAKPGTVKVTEKMIVEKYSHVMHIVSNVEGSLDADKDSIDALIAGFPAGTLTGAPKIRAMEIIDELEKERRSFYGGTVGYFSSNGNMDTCIAIRTGLVKNKKLYIQAGGGVVADSVEHDEFMETENKARAVIKAAEMAKQRYEGN